MAEEITAAVTKVRHVRKDNDITLQCLNVSYRWLSKAPDSLDALRLLSVRNTHRVFY